MILVLAWSKIIYSNEKETVKDSYLESPVFGAMSPDRLSYVIDSIYEMFNNGDSEYWIEPIFPVG